MDFDLDRNVAQLSGIFAGFATPNDEPGIAGVPPAECGQDARAPRGVAMIFKFFHVKGDRNCKDTY